MSRKKVDRQLIKYPIGYTITVIHETTYLFPLE